MDQATQSEQTPPSGPRPGAIREAILVGFLVVAVLVGGAIWIRSRSNRDPYAVRRQQYAQYVGDVSCRECHPGITAQHARSGHSRTLHLAKETPGIEKMEGRVGTDPEYPGVTFRYHYRDGVLSATREAPDTDPETLLLHYVMGSGNHAWTFLSLNDGRSSNLGAMEHRLTLFSDGKEGRFGITPGQDAATTVRRGVKTPRGRALNVEETLKCFACHSTVLSDRGGLGLEAATLIPTVSCERCHGPARGHVEAARRGETVLTMPFGRKGESPAVEMKLCGQCHRLPEMAPPGAVRPDNPELARFQPVSLMQSNCYKGTNAKLRCTTCHDAHTRTSNDVPAYEAICIKCHQAAPQAVCSVSTDKGCVGCHMPKRDAGQGILFTDHWIKVYSGEQAKKP